MIRSGRTVTSVRKDIYPRKVAQQKLRQALRAGILLLETFRPAYLDGGGTRVVVKINGKTKETIIPMFMDKGKGNSNYKPRMAISRILNDFDRDAYEIPQKR